MDPRTHRYSASKGIPGLRKAQASYYGRRFGVKLNPDTQVVATLGSKEGFANMAQAITAPGDVVLVPNPTYPIHAFGFIMSRRRRPLHAGRAQRGFPALARSRRAPLDPQAHRAGAQLPGQSDRLHRDARFLQRGRQLLQRARHLHPLRSRLFRDLFRRRCRRPRCSRCPAPWTSPSSSPRCPRPIRCPAGASASPSATSG